MALARSLTPPPTRDARKDPPHHDRSTCTETVSPDVVRASAAQRRHVPALLDLAPHDRASPSPAPARIASGR